MYYSKTRIHELNYKTEETTKRKVSSPSRQILCISGTSSIQSKYLCRELYLELDDLLQGISAHDKEQEQDDECRLCGEVGGSARGRGF